MLRKLFTSGKDGKDDRDGNDREESPLDERPDGSERPAAASLEDLPREAALTRIAALDDAAALLDLALGLRDELRRAVLDHPLLQSPEQLTALEKRSRHRDKSLNRHARRRLERFRALQQEAQACRARAVELGEAIARHDAAAADRIARDRLVTLHQRLTEALDRHQTLEAAVAEFGERLPPIAVARPDPLPSEPVAEQAAAPGRAPDNAAADDPFEPLVAGFEALDHDMHAGRVFDDIAAARQTLTERWLTEADHRPPSEAQHRVFETVSHRFRELADAVDRLQADYVPGNAGAPLQAPAGTGQDQGAYWRAVTARREHLRRLERARERARWPAWAPPSPAYTGLLDDLARLHDELAAADRYQAEQLDALVGVLDRLGAAIDGGHLGEGQTLLAEAHAIHDALPRGTDRKLGSRLGQLAARLAELKDWQTFATSPKREALVAAMAALLENPLPAPDQADRIKALRRDWQALGPVAQAADGRLADRFNSLAETAFEPCRRYFAEQAERRRANLAERQRICEQLEAYLDETDWSHADMRAAEQIMRAARDEWRRFHPVERSAGRALETRFEGAQSRLHDKVKAEWERNVHAREALVAEAERLLEARDEPVAERIEQIKGLQRRWRDVGITPHGPNQRLWRQFRQACDGVFADRDQSRRQALVQAEAQLAACRQTLEDFAARLDHLDPGDTSEEELRDFRRRLEGLERLPAAARRDLAAQRGELIGRYRSLLSQRARARRLAWLDTLEHDDRAAGGPAAAADQVRRLAVHAELAAGLASPAEDEALRLEVQVQRLQAGLSGDGADDVNRLIERWQALGAKDAALAPLRERFFAALRTLQ